MMRKILLRSLVFLILILVPSIPQKYSAEQSINKLIIIDLTYLKHMIFENEIPKQYIPANQQPEFIKKVKTVSKDLGIDPDWLMMTMKSESGFKPSAKNPYGSASGLIQITDATATTLHTTTSEIRNMDAVKQLDYVKAYYRYWLDALKMQKYDNFTDLYLVTFYPYALSQNDDYIIGSHKGKAESMTITKKNPGLFTDEKSGLITKGSFKKWVLEKKVPAEYKSKFDGSFLKKVKDSLKNATDSINEPKQIGTKIAIFTIMGLGLFLIVWVGFKVCQSPRP